MTSAGSDLLIQFIPMITLGLIYAVVVFIIARKRGINPWGWTIGAAIPLFGILVAAIFFLISFLSVFDRLNALESGSKAPQTPYSASNPSTNSGSHGFRPGFIRSAR